MHLTEIFTQKLAQEVLSKYMLVPYFPCKLFIFITRVFLLKIWAEIRLPKIQDFLWVVNTI